MQGANSQIAVPGGGNNKKSEFFGFFGYPYGYYGYRGGYYDYPYDSYPYRWSRWWYNNGYGKQNGQGIKIIVIHYRHETEHLLETPGLVTEAEARLAMKWFTEANINVYDSISGKDEASKFKTWRFALQEEAKEHGSLGGAATNVTRDDLLTTAKIAVAHFKERSDYYHRLYKAMKQGLPSLNILGQSGVQTHLPTDSGMQGLPSRRQQQQQQQQQANIDNQSCYYYYSY